jgi:uncharacterized cupin superfamily protein
LSVVGIAHLDEIEGSEVHVGHLHATWSFLGRAAGAVGVGLTRLQIPAGGWSTPAHDHGVEEELFYVLGGRGLAWHKGETFEIGEGDCILFLPRRGHHTLHALDDLDVLAFGPRVYDESARFPRIGGSLVGIRYVESIDGSTNGLPTQFVREAELGPPELPEPSPRPPTIVNIRDVEPQEMIRPRIQRTRRNLGTAVGSVTTGLQHVEVVPGMLSAPLHCHSMEEEIFVILGGDGLLLLDDEEIAMRPGHVVSCRPDTGVSHSFRGGKGGLTYLAYGPRVPGDACFYPTSNKVAIGGVVFRVEPLDYWDGED